MKYLHIIRLDHGKRVDIYKSIFPIKMEICIMNIALTKIGVDE